jgi:hypothetical protein
VSIVEKFSASIKAFRKHPAKAAGITVTGA